MSIHDLQEIDITAEEDSALLAASTASTGC